MPPLGTYDFPTVCCTIIGKSKKITYQLLASRHRTNPPVHSTRIFYEYNDVFKCPLSLVFLCTLNIKITTHCYKHHINVTVCKAFEIFGFVSCTAPTHFLRFPLTALSIFYAGPFRSRIRCTCLLPIFGRGLTTVQACLKQISILFVLYPENSSLSS